MGTSKIEAIIEANVKKLNLDWFEHKKKSFESHKHYIHGENIIRFPLVKGTSKSIGSVYSVEEKDIRLNDEDVEFEDIHEFTLRQFCYCYLPLNEETAWGVFPIEPSHYQFKKYGYGSKEIAKDLVNEVAALVSDRYSTKEVIKFISLVNEIAVGEVEKLRSKSSNVSYNLILDEFLKYQKRYLDKKFERELLVEDMSWESEDTLTFDLNAEQLLSLLFLLREGKLLKGEADKKFNQFSSKYFHFTKSKGSKPFQSVDAFRKKYNEVANAIKGKKNIYNPKDQVINKLRDVIDLYGKGDN